MTQEGPEQKALLDELLGSLGGAERIASVRTYAREAALSWTPGRSRETGIDPHSAFSRSFAFMNESGGREARERVLRAAPGRARVEVLTIRERDGRPLSRAWTGEPVLHEARFEPRVLLAHARERGAEARAATDGGIEIVVPSEGLLYRFDPATLLCAGRTHLSSGASTLYLDWRRVDGIATPFHEIEMHRLGRLERRVVAVAYDLPWPDRALFPDPSHPAGEAVP